MLTGIRHQALEIYLQMAVTLTNLWGKLPGARRYCHMFYTSLKLDSKLHTSSFHELEEFVVLTRSVRKILGLTRWYSRQEVNDNLPILDTLLVQQAQKSAVICKHCRSRKSAMMLCRDDTKIWTH